MAGGCGRSEAEAARARLAAIQAIRGEQEEAVGMASQAVHQDASGSDVLSRLARYETTLERGLYRALRELERLQADRLDSAGYTFVSQKTGSLPPLPRRPYSKESRSNKKVSLIAAICNKFES